MAKIQRKVQGFLAIAAALAAGGCVLETTSEKREFGQADSAKESCTPTGSCGDYTCGTVPDGCGGEVSCGPTYLRDPENDYPFKDAYGAGCAPETPYNWRCGAAGIGGPSPRNTCIRWSPYSSTWCCAQGS